MIDNESQQQFSHKRFAITSFSFVMLCYIMGAVMLYMIVPNPNEPAMEAGIQGLGQLLFMALPALFIMQYSTLGFYGLLRFKHSITIPVVVAAFVGLIGVQLFSIGFSGLQELLLPQWVLDILGANSDELVSKYKLLLGGEGIVNLIKGIIVGALVPAFAEEVLFRGVLQRTLEEVYTPLKAILYTSLVFALIHFNIAQFAPLLLIALLLGATAYSTQSLLVVMALHFANNLWAIIALHSPYVQALDDSSQFLTLYQAVGLAAIGLFVALASISFILKRSPSKTEFVV